MPSSSSSLIDLHHFTTTSIIVATLPPTNPPATGHAACLRIWFSIHAQARVAFDLMVPTVGAFAGIINEGVCFGLNKFHQRDGCSGY
ncbi:hypothetical protein Tco_1509635 [Tanacetum coccineum]